MIAALIRRIRDHLELWLTAVSVLIVVPMAVALSSSLNQWQIATVTAITIGIFHGIGFWILRQRRRIARRVLVEGMQQIIGQQIADHLAVLETLTPATRLNNEIAAVQQSAAMITTLVQTLLEDSAPSFAVEVAARQRSDRGSLAVAPLGALALTLPQPATTLETPVQAVLEAQRDPALICDADGIVDRVNTLCISHFGLSAAPRAGMPLTTVLPLPLATVCRSHIDQLSRTIAFAAGTATVGQRWYSYTLHAAFGTQRRPSLIVITLRDLTGDVLQRAREHFLAVTDTLPTANDANQLLVAMAELAVQGFAEWCAVVRAPRPDSLERITLTCADPARQLIVEQIRRSRVPTDATVGYPQVIRSGQTEFWPQVPPTYVDDLTADPDQRALIRALGIASVVTVPLVIGQQVVGAVAFGRWTAAHAYTEADCHAAEAWAHRASRAVDHADLYRRAQRYLRELTAAQQLARRMAVLPDVSTLLQQIVADLHHAFGYQLVSVYFLIGDRLVLQSYVGYDVVIEELALDFSTAGQVVRTGQPAFVRQLRDDPKFVVVQPGTQQGIIVPLSRRDGTIFGVLLIESTGVPELTADDLSLLQLLADHIGVTADSALLAEQLSAAERTLAAERGLFTQGPVVVFRWGTGPGWPVEYVSANIAQFGYDAQHVIQTQAAFTTMIAAEDRERIRLEVHGYQRSHAASFEQRYRVQLPDGTTRWVNDVTVVRRDPQGAITHYDGYLLDITEQVQTETARQSLERQLLAAQKLESLGLLAAGVAHDFNNLLAVIVGNTSMLLLDIPADSPLRQYLSHIKLAARRATDLTQQILTYAGKSRLNARLLDLNAIVAEVTELFETTLATNVALHSTLAPDLPPIMGDPTQLHQITTNLVVNAQDALDQGGGQIWLVTAARQINRHPELADGVYVALTVSDTGSGMDVATQARMFDPFFSTKPKGRGLGLAAVLGIVRMHGGTIDVRSAMQVGTSITILLPAQLSETASGTMPLADGELRPPSATLVHTANAALVIDDEDAVREAVAQMLIRLGLRPLQANSGMAGVILAREHAADLAVALVDVTMPGMSGIEVREQLRAAYPHLPVLLMSGYSQIDVPALIGADPLTAFQPKPFAFNDLQAALAELYAATR